MRIKYPNWVQGAYAASAPILSFEGYLDPYAWYDIATQAYEQADEKCPVTIKAGFE
jgi:hypothetical protein